MDTISTNPKSIQSFRLIEYFICLGEIRETRIVAKVMIFLIEFIGLGIFEIRGQDKAAALKTQAFLQHFY
jgi:hypothetical protein